MKEIARTIGETVKFRRAQMGKSQAELAEALEIDLRTVQNVEAGDKIPAGTTLYRIACVMNLSIDRMFFPGKSKHTTTHDMLMRRIDECDERKQRVLLVIANTLLEKE